MDESQARAAYAALDHHELADWSTVKAMHDWAVILLGNGASCAIWSRFGYGSLYRVAQRNGGLPPEDVNLFKALNTSNFEGVLAGLQTALKVDGALGLDVAPHLERYESVRDALVSAVHAVHIPWKAIPEDTFTDISEELREYEYVFSTNYDLVVYWAAMCDEPRAMPDYFWRKDDLLVFDPLDTEISGKRTKLLFLHGGLHLYRLSDGRTFKRKATPTKNLLELFGDPLDFDPAAVPLFVSEGSAEDKLTVIRSSDYLSFALKQLAESSGPLVIFGQSLSEQDQHLLDVLRGRSGPIAVSLRAGDPDDVEQKKHFACGRLGRSDLLFFNASSHPLGDPSLMVSPVDVHAST
jgi:hypothetical protein